MVVHSEISIEDSEPYVRYNKFKTLCQGLVCFMLGTFAFCVGFVIAFVLI